MSLSYYRKKDSGQTGSGDGLNNETKSVEMTKKDSPSSTDFRYKKTSSYSMLPLSGDEKRCHIKINVTNAGAFYLY